jgi:hypothetical protein
VVPKGLTRRPTRRTVVSIKNDWATVFPT